MDSAGPLPESFAKLPADENFKEVKSKVPGKKVSADKTPKVFVSLIPAEMILLTGEPKYVPVTGAGSLQWVSNTTSDVFRMGPAGPVYYLVAGRWFSAPDFTGPWTFATPKMPEEFKRIPLEHERSRVLASVPGTQQAAEAVLLAQIPQTARVTKATKAPEVTYDGAPQFQPVEKTTVSRAVNTDKDILKVGDLYYMCFQGVWFMSRTPTGPWEVTGDVPKAIYEIPPSSPSYNVTYVTVQESNDDAVIFATALAFTGVMIAWGCAVHGTGYYYPPYMHYGVHPVYYPHYPTYGYGASYNPWTGAYGRSAVAYGPYGGAGVSAKYNPRTGTYSRSAAAYGPYGSAAVGQAYNPRTGAYGQTRQGSNVYGNWGSTTVARGDDWAQTAHKTNYRTGTSTGAARTSEGGAAVTRSGPAGQTTVARSGSGDVYAGHDGNVYKKDGDSYQKYENGSWNTVQAPTQEQKTQAKTQAQSQAQARGAQTGTQATGTARAQGAQAAGTQARPATSSWSGDTASQVQKDASARAAGTQRTSAYSGVQSGSGRASSYGGGSSRALGPQRRRGRTAEVGRTRHADNEAIRRIRHMNLACRECIESECVEHSSPRWSDWSWPARGAAGHEAAGRGREAGGRCAGRHRSHGAADPGADVSSRSPRLDARKATPPPRFEVKAPDGAPNVLIVLIDDMGFGMSSAFGGPIQMPTVERLANEGLRYNQFHTTALCSPTRTALLSGRNHHTNNMGSHHGDGHRVPGQHGAAAEQRGAAGRDAAAERLQHELLRQEPRDRGLGGQPLGPHDPVAEPVGVRRVLRVHGRRDQPVGAAPLPRHEPGRAPEGSELPLHDRHDEQGDRLGAVPEVADAGPAVLHVLRAGRDARAAPRAEGVDRQVQGQVRPGVGRDARGGARPPDQARRRAGRARSSPRSPRRSRTGTR